MAYWYEVRNKKTEKVFTAISHPYDKEIPKKRAEKIADKIQKNDGIECVVVPLKE